MKIKFYPNVHFSESLFCCLLENFNLPPTYNEWVHLSNFIILCLSVGYMKQSEKIGYGKGYCKFLT